MYHTHDTIAAIATAAGGGARGIVRVSGSNAVAIVSDCFQPDDGRPLDAYKTATAIAGHISFKLQITPFAARDCQIACDLFLWPGVRSYTRQPLAELHMLGSPPLVEAALATVCRAGARLAEPGEFTLRAFLAGRLDLTQAEAVLGVIDARGNGELAAALVQLAGGLARPLTQLRDELLQLLAELEAGLDFVDEDIRFIAGEEIVERLSQAGDLLANVDRQMTGRLTAAPLPQVVLVGRPNAGKSSLFNALVSRFGTNAKSGNSTESPALVSPVRGTTRDYVTARLRLGPIECELVDTAGEEQVSPDVQTGDAQQAIQTAAQSFAAERRERAAIRVSCDDRASTDDKLSLVRNSIANGGHHELVVVTKADLSQPPERRQSATFQDERPAIVTSSVTGQGIEALGMALGRMLSTGAVSGSAEVVASTAERCRQSVRLATDAFRRAAKIASEEGGDEFVAAEIRSAVDELGKVVGAVYTDDLLDRIFSTFCIGK